MNMDVRDTRKIIEYITEEVLKRISLADGNKNLQPQKRILAIGFYDKEIVNWNQDKYEIDYSEEITQEVDIDQYEHILVRELKINELTSIALGLNNTPMSQIITKAILKSKDIYVADEGVEYKKYSETANFSFYNMMKDYEEKLKSFGVRFKAISEIQALLQGQGKNMEKNPSSASKVESNTYNVKERIITESMVKEIYLNGYREMSFSRNVIITPLAQDYLRRNRIKISKK